MNTITLHGNKVLVSGSLPREGEKAPDFTLVSEELANVTLKDFSGKKKILSVYPSIDTGTCANVARYFIKKAESLSEVSILSISRDLPFALSRFCTNENIKKEVVLLSDTRRGVPSFGELYGLEMEDGPLAGLLARALILLDEDNTVLYTSLVAEITNEPDYNELLKHL